MELDLELPEQVGVQQKRTAGMRAQLRIVYHLRFDSNGPVQPVELEALCGQLTVHSFQRNALQPNSDAFSCCKTNGDCASSALCCFTQDGPALPMYIFAEHSHALWVSHALWDQEFWPIFAEILGHV